MSKTMKQFLSFLLSVLMVCSTCFPASAADFVSEESAEAVEAEIQVDEVPETKNDASSDEASAAAALDEFPENKEEILSGNASLSGFFGGHGGSSGAGVVRFYTEQADGTYALQESISYNGRNYHISDRYEDYHPASYRRFVTTTVFNRGRISTRDEWTKWTVAGDPVGSYYDADPTVRGYQSVGASKIIEIRYDRDTLPLQNIEGSLQAAAGEQTVRVDGLIPDGGALSVKTLDSATLENLADSLHEGVLAGISMDVSDGAGNTWQPDEAVEVTVEGIFMENSSAVKVAHILDTVEAPTDRAELVPVTVTDALADAAALAKSLSGVENAVYVEWLDAEADGSAVVFETDSFSPFVVYDLNAAGDEAGDFVVSGDGEYKYDTENGVLTILSGPVTVGMKDGVESTTHRIVIAEDAEVTIDSLKITAPLQAIKIEAGITAALHLVGESTLTSSGSYAAVEPMFESHELMADLTIDGDGTLNATGGTNSAGIGGSKVTKGVYGNITIKSGTINATGSGNGAGIGSSDNPANGTSSGSYKYVEDQWGTITIDGGVITASAYGSGAGIGGGNHSDSGKIVINDGIITANGHTGIGCGLSSSKPDSAGNKGPGYYFADITINGGTIIATANNGANGAGIGGGMYADALITINGGNITAKGNYQSDNYHHGGAGIGGGYLGNSTITITGGTIDAEGGGAAAGIGSGAAPNNNPDRGSSRRSGVTTCEETTVIISGGTVTAVGGSKGGAGIGGGVGAEKVDITISGGTISAYGGASNEDDKCGGAGIGSGYNAAEVSGETKYMVNTETTVTITAGAVLAIGGWGASGIGSGAKNETAESITIKDAAKIEAYADGTKFAIDTRYPGKEGDEAPVKEERNYTGDILQGTFVFPGEINGLVQDTRGLNPLVVTNDSTGEAKTLTNMPEGYRSFATDVSKAGEYTVFTDDSGISDGKGRYFNVCSSETYKEENVEERNVKYNAEDGKLSDNYFLFPVKAIVVEKKIAAENGEDLSGLNATAYFALWTGGKSGHYITQNADGSGDMWVESIKIENGVPQGKAYFVSVTDGEYDITEIKSKTDGDYASVGDVFGDYELAKIDTTHDGASGDNDGKIDKNQWTDEVTVTNVFRAASFYVYHSSDNTVERIAINDSRVTKDAAGNRIFNITEEVKNGRLYGGYYTKYNKTSENYDSKELTYTKNEKCKFWSVDKGGTAYAGGTGAWSSNRAYTASGETIQPTIGETYYLKEVPTYYLKPYLYVVYDDYDPDHPIRNLFLMTDLDDANYRGMGLIATDITTGKRLKFSTSYTITDGTGASETINAATIAKQTEIEVKGFIAVWQPGTQKENSRFVYTPAFVTPDNIVVEGATTRTVSYGNGRYDKENQFESTTGFISFTEAANEDEKTVKLPGYLSIRKKNGLSEEGE